MINLTIRLPQKFKSNLIEFYQRTNSYNLKHTLSKRPSLQQDVVASVAQDAPFFL
jgi:hypothetical protein